MMKISRLTLLAGVAGLTALVAGCSSEPDDNDCTGDNCPCADITDCPDPFTQFCGPEFICIPRDSGDTGTDPDGEVTDDVPDVGPDVEDTTEDTVQDVGNDVPEDGGQDGGDDTGDTAGDADTDAETDPEDTGTDTDTGTGDTDVDVETGDTGVDVEVDPEPDVVEPPPSLVNPWLVFTAAGDDFLTKIWMIRANGRDLTQIDTGDIVQYDPSFSPDGTVLAFRAIGGLEGPLVKTVDLTTGVVTPIDHGLASLASLDWSPDGTELICEGRTSDSGANDLFRIPLDGSGAIRIAETSQPEAAPFWFDENSVFFITDQDTTIYDLWRRDLTTLEDEQITFSAGIVGAAAINWNATIFAYVQRTGPDSGQLVLQDTVEFTALSVGSSVATGPAFSPDGQFFGYIDLAPSGNREVILAFLDGTTLTTSTNSSAPEAELEIGSVESDSFNLWLLAED